MCKKIIKLFCFVFFLTFFWLNNNNYLFSKFYILGSLEMSWKESKCFINLYVLRLLVKFSRFVEGRKQLLCHDNWKPMKTSVEIGNKKRFSGKFPFSSETQEHDMLTCNICYLPIFRIFPNTIFFSHFFCNLSRIRRRRKERM